MSNPILDKAIADFERRQETLERNHKARLAQIDREGRLMTFAAVVVALFAIFAPFIAYWLRK